jgi:hypothetical protein
MLMTVKVAVLHTELKWAPCLWIVLFRTVAVFTPEVASARVKGAGITPTGAVWAS